MFIDETQADSLEIESQVEEEIEVEDAEPEQETDWEAEAKKWKAIADRAAKKAERTEPKQEVKQTSSRQLTAADLLAISNSKISTEDMDRVESFADWNKISIREALEHPEMKAIISLRQEERATAIATNVESVRRGSVKVTDDTLIENVRRGKIPTNDDDIERVVQAYSKRH